MTKPSIDHLGNSFPSFSAMCEFYGLMPATVHNRLKYHTLQEALQPTKIQICMHPDLEPSIEDLEQIYDGHYKMVKPILDSKSEKEARRIYRHIATSIEFSENVFAALNKAFLNTLDALDKIQAKEDIAKLKLPRKPRKKAKAFI